MDFKHEIQCFRAWASSIHPKTGEWELDYPNWPQFAASFQNLVDQSDCADWDDRDWEDVIFAIARDNECEIFIGTVSKNERLFRSLAPKVAAYGERDAKWQVAAYVAESTDERLAEQILLDLICDTDEYVRRRALTALSILGSKETERLAVEAWETDHLYQRIAALHALHKVGSAKLDHFLRLAKRDGRQHLISNALMISSEREA